MRGTVELTTIATDIRRFIPACAGNSAGPPENCVIASVHPRVCGEQDRFTSGYGRWIGSSPRVRGTAFLSPCFLFTHRFIPACAGNSFLVSHSLLFLPVHPRVCGEQPMGVWGLVPHSGSSPRVRGTATAARIRAKPTRFIPACAGNSAPIKLRRAGVTVHPRVCGEQECRIKYQEWRAGSSPRVRGTVNDLHARAQEIRFIPACAGNSADWCRDRRVVAVHPRVCGEQRNPMRYGAPPIGSSPRVRGTVVPDSDGIP